MNAKKYCANRYCQEYIIVDTEDLMDSWVCKKHRIDYCECGNELKTEQEQETKYCHECV